MRLDELSYGDSFYFPAWPDQIFTYLGTAFNRQTKLVGKCAPSGKLYPKYFSLGKTVVKVHLNHPKN